MRRLARPARWLYALALAGGISWALLSQREAFVDGLRRLSPGTLLGAFASVIGALLLSQLSWAAVLAGLGSPLSFPTSARIFFIGQLGKYLPGSVWPVLTQMQLGRQVGVPRARMAATGVMWVAFSVVSGLAVGLLAVPALVRDSGGRLYVVCAVALLLVLSVTLHPRVLPGLLNRALRMVRRQELEGTLDGRTVVVSCLLLLGVWVMFGVHLWLLVRAVAVDGSLGLASATGAFALASVLGFLALLAPAGAGVRELVLVLALAPVLSTGEATGVAVVSRLLGTLADALMGAVVLAHRPGHPVAGLGGTGVSDN